MSIRNVQGSGLFHRHLANVGRQAPVTGEWVRNPSWLAMPEVSDTDQKFVGLLAVYPDSTFTALTAAGNYTINWGDGTTENIATGVQAQRLYDYTATALDGSNAPVAFTASTSTVNRVSHGYSDGMTVRFYDIVTTTGISEAQVYYVINATANTFQISASVGGSVVSLTNDGSAALLPYKQALVVVTPQSGQNLTALDLNRKHTQSGLQAYESGWLDIVVGSPNFSTTGLVLGTTSSTENCRKAMIERVAVKSLGSTNTLSYCFYAMQALRVVLLPNTAAVTNMSYMFYGCYSLQSVPLFDTSAVTDMGNMFRSCTSLQSVPLFNTAAVTNMDYMFRSCSPLQSVPLFNTAAVTNMSYMFNGCYSLQSVPPFNTAAVTNMSYMFQSCYSLQSVPLFNTAAVTNMSSMFNSCSSLQSVPLFNCSAVTSSTNLASMFNTCYSLARIKATGFRFTFSVASCKLSAEALNELFTNLPTVTGQTITITGNYGAGTCDKTIATNKGWTVTN